MDKVQPFVEYLVQQLVDNPESVQVREIADDDGVTYAVRVAAEDLGKVIGKQGRIANAIRLVAKSAGLRGKRKVYVDIET